MDEIMDDLIYRKKVIEEILQLMKDMKLSVGDTTLWEGVTISPTEAVHVLISMPSADAHRPEIVRCENCRYNPDNPRPFYDDDPVETYAWCKTEYFGEQGFCSCGKLAISLQSQEREENGWGCRDENSN